MRSKQQERRRKDWGRTLAGPHREVDLGVPGLSRGKLTDEARKQGLYVRTEERDGLRWQICIINSDSVFAVYNPANRILEMNGIMEQMSGWQSMLRTVGIEVRKLN